MATKKFQARGKSGLVWWWGELGDSGQAKRTATYCFYRLVIYPQGEGLSQRWYGTIDSPDAEEPPCEPIALKAKASKEAAKELMALVDECVAKIKEEKAKERKEKARKKELS
jgi:hypothetical protein